jgi:hypothetical protein
MDLAREMPLATRIWSAEIVRGAQMIQDFLDTTPTQWVASREQVVRRWTAAGNSPGPDRRQFIGGSDARIIMSSDERALIRLWKEKRGELDPKD